MHKLIWLFLFLCLSLVLYISDFSSFLAKLERNIAQEMHRYFSLEQVEEKVHDRKHPLSVAIEQAAPLQVVDPVYYTSKLVPYEEFSIEFTVSGYIADIYTVYSYNSQNLSITIVNEKKVDAERGDKVKKGDILVQLRTIDYEKRLVSARAALNRALAHRRQVSLDLEKYRTLLESSAIARSEFDKLVEYLDAVVAREEAARAYLKQTMEELRNTTLFSPIDGIITEKYVHRGMLATAGSMAYTVADYSRMKAIFIVPDWFAEQLYLDGTFPVSIDGVGHSIIGHITGISPLTVAERPVFELELRFDNAYSFLQDDPIRHRTVSLLWRDSGLIIEKQGNLPTYQEIPAIPMSALVRPQGKDSGHAVFIVEKQAESTGEVSFYVRECLVKIGRVQGDKVEILSGIHIGDDVVVLGSERLYHGAVVRLLPELSHIP